jgi:multicomponent Na+:H+ antiporter subunit C
VTVFVVMTLLVGALYAAAFYLLLARSTIKLILGLMLLGHAANLLIFTAGGLVRAQPPIVPPDASVPPPGHADPLPQALILTAIVISFAVLAFAAVLVRRAYDATGTDDSEEMRTTES